MSSDVVWSPLAVADLDAAWEWLAIENDEPAAADKMVEAILNRMDVVAAFPLASHSIQAGHLRHAIHRSQSSKYPRR